MFEFAITQNRKRPLNRLLLSSAGFSTFAHLATILILLEYPWILGPGLSHWIRVTLTGRQSPLSKDDEENFRLVGFASDPAKLKLPSAETLKALVYDWKAAGRMTAPPIRLRWGSELTQGSEPAEPKETRPVPGKEEPKPASQGQQAGETAVAQPPGPPGPAQGTGATTSGGTAKTTIYLPAPSPDPKPAQEKAAEASASNPPTTIPSGVKQPPPPPQRAATPPQQANPPATRVFDDEKAAIRTEGSGLFDTKGFPLGDYASAIIERVKGNWFIPSNLRSSQGHTTVIFFITKDGRYSDARIVTSSGSRSLDLAALNAVIVSNPFPPLPQGFPADQVGAKFVFSYNEQQ
jgi:periplasmic protein TonB